MVRGLGPATWFMTFSANDMGWDDLAVALHDWEGQEWANGGIPPQAVRDEWLANLTKVQRTELLLNNQVGAARHFSQRWEAFLQWLQESRAVGEIVDFFWRVEFQRRGSPHIHMLVWTRECPDLTTPEGLAAAPAFLDAYTTARLPPPGGDAAQEAVRELGGQLQQHRHTHTCYRTDAPTCPCRFKYPKQESRETRLRTADDVGLRSTDILVQARGPEDVNTVPFNEQCLLRWQANMDIQLVGSVHGTAAYVCSYMTKGETEGLQDCIREAMQRAPEQMSDRNKLIRIGTAVLSQRQYSMQEATYLLCGLLLRGTSRTFVSLGIGYPNKRTRILDSHSNFDRADNKAMAVKTNIYDHYAHRPIELEDLTLYQFAQRYEILGEEPRGTGEDREVHAISYTGS